MNVYKYTNKQIVMNYNTNGVNHFVLQFKQTTSEYT
jgi:hypothetical protein